MKTKLTVIIACLLFSFSSLYAQEYPHIPPGHDHNFVTSGNCWSYATARAFGRGDNHSSCAALTLDLNTGAVPNPPFD